MNEYNIVDRIKNANEELFATPTPPSPSVLNRKVTFREVLEDYEPHEEDGPDISATMESIPQESDETEPSPLHEGTSTNSVSEDCLKDNMSDTSDHEIEEICEEVDSLEVQDPNSDCERSECAEIKQLPENNTEGSCLPTPSSQENLSTVVSFSSEDSSSSHAQLEHQDERQQSATKGSSPEGVPQAHPQSPSENRSKHKLRPQYGGDILKLRLSYKTCCEYKNAIDNLPRYSGYFSQYGLSKEQWERREKRYERNRKKFLEKSLRTAEVDSKKNEDNERAFSSWLRNKMRFPLNKTKNMFDFKPSKLKRKRKPNETAKDTK